MSGQSTPGISRSQILAAAIIALVTAVLGFWLTWGGLETRGRRASFPALDRRLAETGRVNRPADLVPRLKTAPKAAPTYVPPTRTQRPPPSSSGSAWGSAWPTQAEAGPTQPLAIPSPTPQPHPSPAPPRARKIVAPPLGGERNYPGGRRKGGSPGGGGRGTGDPALDSGGDPGGPAPGALLPYPPAPSARREEATLAEAWALGEGSYVLLEIMGGPGAGPPQAVGSGVLLDGTGLAVVGTSSLRGPAGTFRVGGRPTGGRPVAGSPSYGLSLVRLEGAPGPTPPLAPGPVSPGDFLAMGPGFQSPGLYQTAEVVQRLPGPLPGLFQFRGLMVPAAAGAPLFNRRGELVGVALGRPWGYPGNGYEVAVDSSVLYRLLQGGADESGPGGDLAVAQVRGLLLRDVPVRHDREGARGPNGRVQPGESLGHYRLGMPWEDLERELGVGRQAPLGSGFDRLTYPVHNLEFTLLDGRVVAISTTDPFYATSSGVSVGVSWSSVRPGPELSEALPGYYLGSRRVLVAPGLEVEVGASGRVARLLVTSASDTSVAREAAR